MLKMASGVAAKTVGPRGFMWAVLATVVAAVPVVFWVYGASVPLLVWLSLNGGMLLISAFVCALMSSDGYFDWEDVDRPPVLWAVFAVWMDGDKPSWLRLILWMLLIPAEVVATFVLRPITLAVRALLKPIPGKWD